MTISAGRGISFAYLRTGQQHGQQQMAANSWLLLGESTSADSSARSRSFKASALLIPLPNYFQCRTGPSPQIRGKFPVVGHTSCQEALAFATDALRYGKGLLPFHQFPESVIAQFFHPRKVLMGSLYLTSLTVDMAVAIRPATSATLLGMIIVLDALARVPNCTLYCSSSRMLSDSIP